MQYDHVSEMRITLGGDVREYFTLRPEAERARSVEGERKAPLARSLERARELRRGAEVLWNGGCTAQALRLAIEALDASLAAAREAAGTDAEAEPRRVLTTLALEDEAAAEVVAARSAIAELEAPEADAEVTPAHVQLFPRITGASLQIQRAVAPYAMTERDLEVVRRSRYLRAATIAVLVLIAVFLIVRAQFRMFATASAQYGPPYEPANVLDSAVDSEWLLPDKTLGWIDVTLSPARSISKVHLTNAHNPEHDDRATKEFRVEVYRKGQLVTAVDSAFPEFTSTPKRLTIELGQKATVDRVRVIIKSYFLSGGGLAELTVD